MNTGRAFRIAVLFELGLGVVAVVIGLVVGVNLLVDLIPSGQINFAACPAHPVDPPGGTGSPTGGAPTGGAAAPTGAAPTGGAPTGGAGAFSGWNLALELGLGFAAAAPMVVVFLVFLRSSWRPLVRIREILKGLLYPFLREIPVTGTVVLSAAAGLGEELLFRGLLLGALVSVIGPVPALIVSSVAFGLAHPLTFTYIVFAGVTGLYLGALYLFSGSLLVPVAAHAAYDAVALLLLRQKPL
jgi:membrane protease YdiL (CAAX protease family)